MRLVSSFFIFIALTFPAVASFAQASDGALEEGVELFEKGDFEASRRVFSELVKRNPRSALYWYNLGNADVLSDHLREATVAYRQVDVLGGPLAVPANLYRARAHLLLGNRERALEILERMQKSEMSPEFSAWVREEVEHLSSPLGDAGYLGFEIRKLQDPGGRREGWILVVDLSGGFSETPSVQVMVDAGYGVARRLGGWDLQGEVLASARAESNALVGRAESARGGASLALGGGRAGAEVLFEGGAQQDVTTPTTTFDSSAQQLRIFWGTSAQDPDLVGSLIARFEQFGSGSIWKLTDFVVGPSLSLGWHLGARWRLQLDGGYSRVFIAGDGSRIDWRANAATSLVWQAKQDMAVHAGGTLWVIRSDEPAYAQVSVLAGVSWAVL